MNSQAVVVVILRLIALFHLLQMITLSATGIVQFYETARLFGLLHEPPDIVFGLIQLIVSVSGAVLLWIYAAPISKLITRNVSPDLSTFSLSLVDCYTIVFVGLGLYHISTTVPSVLYWSYNVFSAAVKERGDKWFELVSELELWRVYVAFIIGVVLVIKGRSWSTKLARSHQVSDPNLHA